MALGEVQRAETLQQAAELLGSLPVEGGGLVGANEFSLRKSYLFLPRLLWHGNTLKVFLYGALRAIKTGVLVVRATDLRFSQAICAVCLLEAS